MGTRTTRIRRTNADFNLLDADDTDDADFLSCAIHTGISHRRKKESASSVSERLLARRRRTLLQRYAGKLSFIEYKIHCQYQANECRKMIPVQAFTFKKDSSKYSENNKSNHLLNYLQLYQ